jgi:diguanylate cyclase (GGDEF)-like protein/PAS domain S-box-containing protein
LAQADKEERERTGDEIMSNALNPTLKQRLFFDSLMNGIYFVDRKRNITYWNPAAEQISGWRADEVIGKSCKDDILVHSLGGHELCSKHCPLLAAIEQGKNHELVTYSVYLQHKDGYRVPVRVRCVPILDEEEKVVGATEIFEYAYVKEELQHEIKKMGQVAYSDALTNIPNRLHLENALNEWLCAYYDDKPRLAVVMADIDFFKNVNDEYGHNMGDLVLKNVASTLQQNLRTLDIVGRWGGEEFMILLQNIKSEQLDKRLESLRASIENSQVEGGGKTVKVTMSFGCAIPRDAFTGGARRRLALQKQERGTQPCQCGSNT